ncbi:MAG: hypothetical protein ACTSRZ_09725 [Promethearchaeota archaeon]
MEDLDNIFFDQYDLPEYFIRKLIEARILGTGTHLQFSPNKNELSKISYAKIPIKKIEEPLFTLVEIIFQDFLPIIPENVEDLLVDKFEQRFFEIYRKYRIKKRFLNKFLKEIRDPPENWNYMDKPLKIIMCLNAFFNALDESMIADFKRPIKRLKYLHDLLQRENPDAPEIKYYLEDFGFVFRARMYIDLTAQLCRTNEFNEIISMLDEYLINLYIKYFVEEMKPYSVRMVEEQRLQLLNEEFGSIPEEDLLNTVNTTNNTVATDINKQIKINDINAKEKELKRLITQKLNSDTKQEILDAFDLIEKNNYKDLAEKLEYFFNNSDEEITDKAFNLYLKLKNYNLE